MDHLRQQFLKNLWRWKCGLEEKPTNQQILTTDINELYQTQWCDEFEFYMRNRLVMGAFRYGRLGKQDLRLDNTGSIIKRVKLYEQTRNLEHLVDIANLALVEYIRGEQLGYTFEPQDDVDHHTELREALR